ncbi:hypothetical protein GCM10007891_09740 [Methylophaga thalassica]|uniref:Uncharacterized protein n=1 Tax=Methylophaga thalassica TaxID=40223 RepID=A0ABQ5TTL2_9GAMM|nr:hypothetical protein [Methylophaga thalassica]GLP99120.1 hypothetical protein GCM10007891_09740 [Methylophaga thalassica]
MSQIKVKFSIFIEPGAQNPVFKDGEGIEYFWSGGDNGEMKVASRHFWDVLGYNKGLTYTISDGEENGVTDLYCNSCTSYRNKVVLYAVIFQIL